MIGGQRWDGAGAGEAAESRRDACGRLAGQPGEGEPEACELPRVEQARHEGKGRGHGGAVQVNVRYEIQERQQHLRRVVFRRHEGQPAVETRGAGGVVRACRGWGQEDNGVVGRGGAEE